MLVIVIWYNVPYILVHGNFASDNPMGDLVDCLNN